MKAEYQFLDAYMTAALWSTSDDDDQPLDANYSRADISAETFQRMHDDCMTFYAVNEAAINCHGGPRGRDGSSQIEMAGHDFWLTQQGHGAGFWDGDWPEPFAAQLTAAASEKFKPYDLYVGDDGRIYHG